MGGFSGGFNGGGKAGDNTAGGGASDVREGGSALTDRVVVAGGGGGGGSQNGGVRRERARIPMVPRAAWASVELVAWAAMAAEDIMAVVGAARATVLGRKVFGKGPPPALFAVFVVLGAAVTQAMFGYVLQGLRYSAAAYITALTIDFFTLVFGFVFALDIILQRPIDASERAAPHSPRVQEVRRRLPVPVSPDTNYQTFIDVSQRRDEIENPRWIDAAGCETFHESGNVRTAR